MKILVTGPRGFVGKKIMDYFPDAFGAPSLRDADEKTVKAILEEAAPDLIIHTAAISDIPTCDRYPEESYRANVELPLLLAKCNSGAKLVVFSSDQVYCGCKEPGPFVESITCPGNLYAREKLEMENRVLDIDPNAVMLRAEWMYDYIAPKSNFFLNTLNAEGPIHASKSHFRGVTYVREVAEAMLPCAKLPGGAYNFGSETKASMFDVTTEFLAFMGKNNPVLDCPAGHNLWMDCSKARALGVDFSTVSEGLKKCARDYGLR